MRDQASALRNLMQRPAATEPETTPFGQSRARMLTFVSGKGGVGQSNLALNVAVALAQQKSRVCLLDANVGLSNLDLLCGLNCYWNLIHVLTGAKPFSEVILKGPCGINILTAADSLAEFAAHGAGSQELIGQVESLEHAYDVLIVDAPSGLHSVARQFVAASDMAFVVTTPEPTAIAGAYAVLKFWQAELPAASEVLVNRAESAQQARQILERIAQTSELFLRQEFVAGSFVSEAQAVPKAVAARQPFVNLFPDSSTARDVQQIARRLVAGSTTAVKEPLLQRLRISTG